MNRGQILILLGWAFIVSLVVVVVSCIKTAQHSPQPAHNVWTPEDCKKACGSLPVLKFLPGISNRNRISLACSCGSQSTNPEAP